MKQRARRLFGLDEEWERPLPGRWLRTDALTAVVAYLVGIGVLQTMSASRVLEIEAPLWQQLVFLAIPSAALVARRRYPLSAALVGTAVVFLGGFWIPTLTAFISTQAISFFLAYSAAAWARNRWHVVLLASATGLALLLWMAWLAAQASGASRIAEIVGLDNGETLSLWRILAFLFYNVVINIVFFFGALGLGAVAWWDARRTEQVADYGALVEEQSATLARQAVTAERLRIARELHDVVAHHVSAIGVQAGAARRVLERSSDFEAARTTVAGALVQVEDSSRKAVTEMRSLLGTLRDSAHVDETVEGALGSGARVSKDGALELDAFSARAAAADVDRSPAGPGLEHLDELIADVSRDRPIVAFDIVEDPAIPRAEIPAGVSASLYRIAQEALSNVRTHSTATSARLTLRTGRAAIRGEDTAFAEVEVVDDGRPRHGTAGTGMGQLGMRERARSLGGAVEIGPRALGGYRVRVRLPISRKDS